MKISEIREKDAAALADELAGKYKNLHALRTQTVTDKLADPSQVRKNRRDIARIKTVQTDRAKKAAK